MKKIITGLQNTMINNALNTSQAKNKTVPPPPAKPGVPMYTGKPVGPYSPINANIGQLGAEQAKQMVASVVPPPPIAPAADTSMVKSFGGGAENLMMQQSVSDTLTPEMIAQIMGVASGGARVGLTAGFERNRTILIKHWVRLKLGTKLFQMMLRQHRMQKLLWIRKLLMYSNPLILQCCNKASLI